MARTTTDRDAARQLRHEQTGAENVLWNALRNRQVLNLKFRRQHPLGNYIADFCCLEKGLIIELDGSQHLDRVLQDEERTRWLNSQGFHVLRFCNHEVTPNPEGAIEKIKNHIFQMTLTRPDDGRPLPRGRGIRIGTH
jgi:adenine-specific DNA-methyltransferase